MHSDWAWLRHDEWMSDRSLNPLTFFVTYVFPFGDEDVFHFPAAVLTRDLQRLPVLAADHLQAARCERQKQGEHFFQLLPFFFFFNPLPLGTHLISFDTQHGVY